LKSRLQERKAGLRRLGLQGSDLEIEILTARNENAKAWRLKSRLQERKAGLRRLGLQGSDLGIEILTARAQSGCA
jgi:hypothetical protein